MVTDSLTERSVDVQVDKDRRYLVQSRRHVYEKHHHSKCSHLHGQNKGKVARHFARRTAHRSAVIRDVSLVIKREHQAYNQTRKYQTNNGLSSVQSAFVVKKKTRFSRSSNDPPQVSSSGNPPKHEHQLHIVIYGA